MSSRCAPSRRQFLTGSAAALGATALSGTTVASAAVTESAPRPRPNIVVILADDLGYGMLGAYGQRQIQTPTLDRLAAEGLRFTQAYSAAAVCAPSRAALLTGLHSGHAAVRQNPFGGPQGSLAEGDTTFAEVLRSRGYRTACIGKWGFGPDAADQPSHPNARGFEEFFGWIGHSHAHQYYPAYLWHNGEQVRYPENVGAKVTYAPDLLRERAVRFVERASDEPFLLYLTPTMPHSPSDVPDHAPYGDRPWSNANKGHAAQITRLDGLVGAVVAAVRELDRDTIVFVTSDNGPHEEGSVNPDLFDANGPLRGYKRNLYEGGVRVPLIAWSPGRIAPGVSDRPTPQIDLLPTLAELAGAPAPRDVDGLSIASLLGPGDAGAPAHRHLYWYRNDPGNTARANAVDGGRIGRLAEAARQGDWKAVRFAPARDRTAPDAQWQVELYDLSEDPGETRDLAARHPDIAADLVGLMRRSWADSFPRDLHGVSLEAPDDLVPGVPYTVTARLGNASARTWTAARLRLVAPGSWRVRHVTSPRADRLDPGETITATWEITVPERSTARQWRLTAIGAAASAGPLRFTAERRFTPPPEPPAPGTQLSDHPWLRAENGWGPVELDTSNGRDAAGDGPPISFGGTTYAKGLGVHAYSEIVYYLGGELSRFTALVGIDDFSANQNARGGTIAQVFGDGAKLFDSGLLKAATGPKEVDVDVTGVRLLRLVVRDGNSDTSFDHTSWADARVHGRAQ